MIETTYCNSCIKKNISESINEKKNNEIERNKFNFLSDKNYLLSLNKDSLKEIKITENLKESISLKDTDNIKEAKKNVTINETKNTLKIMDEDKKQLLINEMKDLSNKLTDLEYLIREVYICAYILVSKDVNNVMHLHGVYSKLDNATIDYNTIISDLEKYKNVTRLSKLILYKTYINDFHISLDTSLCDDPEMTVILQKKF
jgi:hypothetical protein